MHEKDQITGPDLRHTTAQQHIGRIAGADLASSLPDGGNNPVTQPGEPESPDTARDLELSTPRGGIIVDVDFQAYMRLLVTDEPLKIRSFTRAIYGVDGLGKDRFDSLMHKLLALTHHGYLAPGEGKSYVRGERFEELATKEVEDRTQEANRERNDRRKRKARQKTAEPTETPETPDERLERMLRGIAKPPLPPNIKHKGKRRR